MATDGGLQVWEVNLLKPDFDNYNLLDIWQHFKLSVTCGRYAPVLLPEICLRGWYNKIHTIKNPSEALPNQVFQVVA